LIDKYLTVCDLINIKTIKTLLIKNKSIDVIIKEKRIREKKEKKEKRKKSEGLKREERKE
jgi:hypothetical protein